ncbi:hypothetical protein F4779DRAFT_550036 [Xylariaceae sp. FL0662B]|nr:hypothetical protein F4779DRAFT_550036 [Xylariaceae sp. FL0662B]
MRVFVPFLVSAASAAALPLTSDQPAQGLPLDQFGSTHSITLDDAMNFLDLLGNNFTLLPISSLEDKIEDFFEDKLGIDIDLGGDDEEASTKLPSATKVANPGENQAEDQPEEKEPAKQFSSTKMAGAGGNQAEEQPAQSSSAPKPSPTKVHSQNGTAVDNGPVGGQSGAPKPSQNGTAVDGNGNCVNPNTRYEWDNYPASDKKAFVDAIQCLVESPASGKFSPAKNRYEDLVRLHQSYSPEIHSKGTQQQTHKFLLWHRYYVWAFEQVLRDECGFDRPFPWWDEKKWAGKFTESTIFTKDYFGTLPKATNGSGTCVTDGRFAGMQVSLGPAMTTDYTHCLQRAVDEAVTSQVGQKAWDTCFSRTSWPEFHSCVEFTYHANGHNSVGATMADAIASPGDPTFFMHHLFIDYGMNKWQLADPKRTTSISGCADVDTCTPLSLDTVIHMGNICGDKCPDLKVRDLINTQKGHFCYRYKD